MVNTREQSSFLIWLSHQVVISGALNYSDTQVQNDLEDLLSSLENTTYIDPIYTESWLRDFTDYVR